MVKDNKTKASSLHFEKVQIISKRKGIKTLQYFIFLCLLLFSIEKCYSNYAYVFHYKVEKESRPLHPKVFNGLTNEKQNSNSPSQVNFRKDETKPYSLSANTSKLQGQNVLISESQQHLGNSQAPIRSKKLPNTIPNSLRKDLPTKPDQSKDITDSLTKPVARNISGTLDHKDQDRSSEVDYLIPSSLEKSFPPIKADISSKTRDSMIETALQNVSEKISPRTSGELTRNGILISGALEKPTLPILKTLPKTKSMGSSVKSRSKKPITIYVAGAFYGFHTFLHNGKGLQLAAKCPISCRIITHSTKKGNPLITHDKNGNTRPYKFSGKMARKNADIILRNKPSIGRVRPMKKGQKIGFLSLESGHYSAAWNDRKRSDFEVTFRRQAEISVNYISNVFNSPRDFANQLKDSLNVKPDPNMDLASAFISNCDSLRRRSILSKLMKMISVASYGMCLRNRSELMTLTKFNKITLKPSKRKVFLTGKHMFALAFENAPISGYVTEKFYQALVSGAIPVYYGAPNIRQYLPSWDFPVIINLRDFKNEAALAHYLVKVSKDKALYDSYHVWKTKPIRPEFLELFDQDRLTIPCRLCKYHKEQQELEQQPFYHRPQLRSPNQSPQEKLKQLLKKTN